MARPLKSLSSNEDNDSTNEDRQAGISAALSARVRSRAELRGVSYTELMDASGMSSSAFANYWTGKRTWSVESLVAVANRLSSSVDELLGLQSPNVVEVTEADWVMVPTYDLTSMTDGDKGEVIRTTPMRRDWLNAIAGSASGLWLASAPCDYPPVGLVEGDKLLCRDTTVAALHDRHLCIWREADIAQLFIGRYSVVRPESVHIDPDQEYWVGRVNVAYADPPPTIFPVGRIVGRPVVRVR